MQWLIDIIKEWIQAQGYALESWVLAKGYATEAWVAAQIFVLFSWVVDQHYLTTSFVDRGDPAAHDFIKTDFTRDGAWHELDLSGIVPAGAKAVSLALTIRSSTVMALCKFRTKGNANEINRSMAWTQVANIWVGNDLVVPLSSDRKIEYNIANIVWTFIKLNVKGWWL